MFLFGSLAIFSLKWRVCSDHLQVFQAHMFSAVNLPFAENHCPLAGVQYLATVPHQYNTKQVCWPTSSRWKRHEGSTPTKMLIQLFVSMLAVPHIFVRLVSSPTFCILLPMYDIWRQKHGLLMTKTTLPWTGWPLHIIDQSILGGYTEKDLFFLISLQGMTVKYAIIYRTGINPEFI